MEPLEFLGTPSPRGATTVEVLVYSDQPGSQSVPLRAMSFAEFYGTKAPPSGFHFTLDNNYGNVGTTVKVTVAAPTEQATDLLVMLAYTSQTSANYWPILVVNDDGADVDAGKPTVIPRFMQPAARPRTRTTSGVPFTTRGLRPAGAPTR